MPKLYIEDLLIDELNEAKMSSHGVTVTEVLSVLDLDDYEVFANPSPDPDSSRWVIVGPSIVRDFVTIPIDATPIDGVYRPRTAFTSSRRQVEAYRRRRPTR